MKFKQDIPGIHTTFTKGARDEIVTIYYDKTQGMKSIQTTKLDEIKDQIIEVTKTCSGDAHEFAACVSAGILDDLTRMADSKSELARTRDLLSDRLRNYTCADAKMETSISLGTKSLTLQDKQYTANTFLDTNSAKIWTIAEFVSEEECNILMTHGKPLLRRATVAAEDGTSIVSENRKANQAVYRFQAPRDSDRLWPLFSRVYQALNAYAGFALEPAGQEEFTIIQYNVDDQYTPHCDGSCDGSMHHSAGRVATAVLYCKVPEIGGSTTFTKADIFVKPTPRMATFFSYKDLLTGRMDDGYTEHSGCPVLEGEKWITTVWMREGVTAADPWDKYDPSGIEIMKENQKYGIDSELTKATTQDSAGDDSSPEKITATSTSTSSSSGGLLSGVFNGIFGGTKKDL